MQIICDKCKAEIQPQPEALRDSEIEYTFFRCPECGEVYPVWRSISEQRRLWLRPD